MSAMLAFCLSLISPGSKPAALQKSLKSGFFSSAITALPFAAIVVEVDVSAPSETTLISPSVVS